MKKLISYNVHNPAPQVHARTKGMGKWRVVVFVENFEERIDIEIDNIDFCDVIQMMPFAMEHLTSAIGELSPVTDGGFTVYKL